MIFTIFAYIIWGIAVLCVGASVAVKAHKEKVASMSWAIMLGIVGGELFLAGRL